jgi:hypothetical protein
VIGDALVLLSLLAAVAWVLTSKRLMARYDSLARQDCSRRRRRAHCRRVIRGHAAAGRCPSWIERKPIDTARCAADTGHP